MDKREVCKATECTGKTRQVKATAAIRGLEELAPHYDPFLIDQWVCVTLVCVFESDGFAE